MAIGKCERKGHDVRAVEPHLPVVAMFGEGLCIGDAKRPDSDLVRERQDWWFMGWTAFQNMRRHFNSTSKLILESSCGALIQSVYCTVLLTGRVVAASFYHLFLGQIFDVQYFRVDKVTHPACK